MIPTLAGSVGCAQPAEDPAAHLPSERPRTVVSTGDDFAYRGMSISPDLDAVTDWQAGTNDAGRGWALPAGHRPAGPGFGRQAGSTGTRLSHDLGTHRLRSHHLRQGDTFSQATRVLRERPGGDPAIVRMSDRPVTTLVHTAEGARAFQDHVVCRRCEPVVAAIGLEGMENAAPAPGFAAAMAAPDSEAVVIRPSNPLLGIAPLLSLPGVRDWLKHRRAPAIAASPIVRRAIEGSAAKIFRELGRDASAVGLAGHCRELIDCRVIDAADAPAVPAIEAEGMGAAVTRTVMKDAGGGAAPARQVLDLAACAPVRAHD